MQTAGNNTTKGRYNLAELQRRVLSTAQIKKEETGLNPGRRWMGALVESVIFSPAIPNYTAHGGYYYITAYCIHPCV